MVEHKPIVGSPGTVPCPFHGQTDDLPEEMATSGHVSTFSHKERPELWPGVFQIEENPWEPLPGK